MRTHGGDGAAPAGRWPRATATRAVRERGRRTLVKLLDATVAEFAEFGYHGVRVARLTQRAGTSHGAFYVYFRSKDDALAALLEDVEAELDVVLLGVPALVRGARGRDAIHTWVHDASTAYQRHGPIVQAVTEALTAGREPEIAAIALRSLARWVDALAERIRAVGDAELDPVVASLAIHALIEAANRALFTGELSADFGEVVEGLGEFAYRAVFGREA